MNCDDEQTKKIELTVVMNCEDEQREKFNKI